MESWFFGENARDSVEHAVRQVFQNYLRSATGNWRFHDLDVNETRWMQVENYENAVEDIKNAEKTVGEIQVKQEKRIKKIEENARAIELIKLKRQPFYTNLEGGLAEKYALLEPSDLLPEISEDFRTNNIARERWKRRLFAGSKDSLFVIPEVSSKPKLEKKIHVDIRKEKNVKSDDSIAHFTASHVARIEKPRRSIMRTEILKTILVAQPNYVKFNNFEPRKTYRRAVLIRNVSNSVAKFQLETRSPRSKVSIVIDSRSGDRENLAPGMNLRMIILLRSDDGDDFEECIVLKVQFGKPVFVVISAYRDPPILKSINGRSSNYESAGFEDNIVPNIESCRSFEKSLEVSWDNIEENAHLFSSESSESNYGYLGKNEINLCGPASFGDLDCKKCFVGEKIAVVTRLKNVGGDGRFFVMSEFDWNSMSIDDITARNSIVLPCFAIWPAYFALKRNQQVDLITDFFPDSCGLQVDKLYIVCDNLAVHPIELIGDGEVYKPGIVTFGINIEENVGFDQSEEEYCGYSLNLGFEPPNGIVKNSITVSNTSGLEIYYRWEKRSTDFNEMTNRVPTWKNLPLDFLSVQPNNGIFRPYSSVEFKIEVQLTNLPIGFYRVVLQLFLEDIPLAAIPKEYENRAERSRKKRRFCQTSRDIRVKEIELWVRCTESPIFEPFPWNISLEATRDRGRQFHQRTSISA